MKNKISVCAILAMGSLIFIIYGSTTIYGMRNQVEDYEETLIGNTQEAIDVNLVLKYTDDDIGWDVNYSIENSIQTASTFKTFYYKEYNSYFAPNVYISSGDFFRSDFSNKIEDDVGEITIQLTDYYEYLPMDVMVSFDRKKITPISGENNLYKIRIPKDATVHIKKEYNSYSIEPNSVPYVYYSNSTSVMIDGKIYFCISNLENQIYYNNRKDSMEYKLTSGILAIEEKDFLTYDDIETIYPIYLENGDKKTILGITSVQEDRNLALATMEDQNIYIHLYDVKNNVLVKKEKVGEIPSDMIISRFEFRSKGDNLLANYEYINADNTESRDALKVVGAVYNITDSNEIKTVLENEYYTKLVKEINENYYTDPEDMVYIHNKLHLVFRNYDDSSIDGEQANSIVLLTMDKEKILYFGIVRNSMIEDYTIGDLTYTNFIRNNEKIIIRNHSRYLSSVKFVD